jgi:multidrug efflux pump subunit AcrA (membrane-fusion protein)
VHIESGRVDKVLSLPYAALQYRYGVNRVFVIDGDKLSARELKVGDRLGERIEIIDGVKAGEQVAITDVDKLVDGMKVTTGKRAE